MELLIGSAVSGAVGLLVKKLPDSGTWIYTTIYKVGGTFERLEKSLKRAQSLISHAEDKHPLIEPWRILLQDLEKLAYNADDLIDKIAIKIVKFKGGLLGNWYLVFRLHSTVSKLSCVPEMNKIQKKLDDFLEKLRVLPQDHEVKQERQQTTSYVDESGVFGRDKDKDKVVQMLLALQESPFSVVPIVGMAGVGKTTLAQLVYMHDYEAPKKLRNLFPFSGKQTHFNLKMWVSVTALDFDIMKLTNSLIEAAIAGSTTDVFRSDSLETLQNKLSGLVKDKKFLLVFDDLQISESKQWDDLLRPLKHGRPESIIIVTTRSLEVSKLVSTAQSYPLQCLVDEDCLKVLKKNAFGNIKEDSDSEFKKIGKKIAMKCKGLPLAAEKVGSRLRVTGNDENGWNKILKGNMWDFIVPHLWDGRHPPPSHVRPCFAYCSLFPQSYALDKVKIVQMWIGGGFIVPNDKNKMIEDEGSDYFDYLRGNSFVQVAGGKFSMHDAVREYAKSIYGKKFFRMEIINNSGINETTRHLSLTCEIIHTTTFEAFYCCKGLRTFLMLGKYRELVKKVPSDLFKALKRLRLLDLSGTSIEDLPGSIGGLKHLRFLDVSNTLLKHLPEMLDKLYMLQTMRLENCSELLHLPKSTSKLRSLQHLELGGNSMLTSMPSGIGELKDLKTLTEFTIGEERGQLAELVDMNNIRGSLCIKQLNKVKTQMEAVTAKLENKKHIHILELQWAGTSDAGIVEQVLDKLKPHESLKELTVRRYGGAKYPSWIGDPSFSKLTSICLYQSEQCIAFPTLGELLKLKFLKVVGMPELTTINGALVGCKLLETLEIKGMSRLVSWVGIHDNEMVNLSKLTIIDCPELVTLPSLHHLSSLKKLEFDNCPKLPSLSVESLSSSIESLIITDCPLLEELYKEGGEGWKKIQHIPHREIGDQLA